jgi:hypothetical protein
VLRIAIRHGESDLADAADRQEASRTVHCLDQSKVSLIAAALITAAVHPLRWLRSLRQAWQMSRASDRGLLRHLAYLIEAAWLMRLLKRHQIPHLHTHFGTNAAAVARLAKSLGGPTYSLTIHGPDEFDSPRGFALREKRGKSMQNQLTKTSLKSKIEQMLTEARELKRSGVDVVTGYFEPHGRRETIALSEELETVPRRVLEYRGSTFEEMDTDAILRRRPQVAVVDELCEVFECGAVGFHGDAGETPASGGGRRASRPRNSG